MTSPTPATRLDDARTELHTALVATMAAAGWPAATAVPLPPALITAPMGWVDAPTLARGTESNGAGTITATFPVAVAVDGTDSRQVQQLDRLLAHGWDLLSKVPRARVLTAGPQWLETPSGQETRGVVFSVQVTLLVRTLCSGSVTGSDEARSIS